MDETTQTEHAEAIHLLATVISQATHQFAPDELDDEQRSLVYGCAWALGMLLNPPPDDGTPVGINALACAREGLEFVAYHDAALQLNELLEEL